jgi:hypothetical protein
MAGVGAGVNLTHVLRNHLSCLILREPLSALGLHRLELGQSCVGTWDNSASAPTRYYLMMRTYCLFRGFDIPSGLLGKLRSGAFTDRLQ